jgi:Spy/CpxP family protein refolding chaperone
MKAALFNRLSLLASGIAFIALLPGLVLATHPVVAQTSSTTGTAMTVQQFRDRLFTGVNLTPEQKNKIQGIRETRRKRLKVALTTPQFSDLRNSMNSGKSLVEAVQSLNPPLSEDQKQRITHILQDTTNQIWNTLTSQQQQTVEANLQGMHRTIVYVE